MWPVAPGISHGCDPLCRDPLEPASCLVQIPLSLQSPALEVRESGKQRTNKTPLCCFLGLPPPARAGPLQDRSPRQPLMVYKSKGGREGSPKSPSQLFTSFLYLFFSSQIQVICIVLVSLQLLAGKDCWEEAGAPQISSSQQSLGNGQRRHTPCFRPDSSLEQGLGAQGREAGWGQ